MAAQTVPSPVLASIDPYWGMASSESDWEYYSDEFWDREASKTRKKLKYALKDRKNTKATQEIKKECPKESFKVVPKLSLGGPRLSTPTVIWKSNQEILKSLERPVVADGTGEKVSLLKDWRERFGHTSINKIAPMDRESNKKSDMHVEDRTLTRTFKENFLPAAPVMLRPANGLLSGGRISASPAHVLPSGIHDESSTPALTQDDSTEEENTKQNFNLQLDNRKRKAEDTPDFDGNMVAGSLVGGLGTPKRQKTADADASAPIVRKGKRGRPKKQRTQSDKDGKQPHGSSEASLHPSEMPIRKRKAENDIANDPANSVPTIKRRRGRPKKSKTQDGQSSR